MIRRGEERVARRLFERDEPCVGHKNGALADIVPPLGLIVVPALVEIDGLGIVTLAFVGDIRRLLPTACGKSAARCDDRRNESHAHNAGINPLAPFHHGLRAPRVKFPAPSHNRPARTRLGLLLGIEFPHAGAHGFVPFGLCVRLGSPKRFPELLNLFAQPCRPFSGCAVLFVIMCHGCVSFCQTIILTVAQGFPPYSKELITRRPAQAAGALPGQVTASKQQERARDHCVASFARSD